MGSLIAQINAVVAMNLRSLPQRVWMSLATLVAVAIVVAVLLAFLAMSAGFQKTVANSGSTHIAVIMREGSATELNSVIMRDQFNLVSTAPGIVKDAKGPVVSGELYLIVDGIKKTTQTEVNLPLRGMGKRGIELRENAQIIAGRMFTEGTNEIVVGAAVLREFSGFELNRKVRLSGVEWTVVGVFDAGGSVFESELWADARVVQSQFNRGSSYQVLRAKLESPANIDPIKQFVESDPTLNLEVVTESDYYADQSKGITNLLFYIGWPLAILMAIGALAGALNTMYTSVAQRATEIATLRALGFGGFSAFVGTLVESLVLAALGGLLGTLGAFLFFDGVSASTVGSSFTQIVFDFRITASSFGDGVILALVIGFFGGVFPAFRAARVPVIIAFSSNS